MKTYENLDHDPAANTCTATIHIMGMGLGLAPNNKKQARIQCHQMLFAIDNYQNSTYI